jgi:hypothetical protein
MQFINKTFALAAILALAVPAMAYKYTPSGLPGQTEQGSAGQAGTTKAAACAPATALRDLEWNNVRALIETGGSMWQDRSTSRAAYEVPKGGGVSSLYAGALWMGGISPDQQLKLAAITFRADGNDFWTGPLTTDGAAEIDEATCQEWDRFFVSERADAQLHRQYFDALAAGTVETEFPDGYVIPQYFFEYPGNGNVALGQDYYLAPFFDYDGNTIYDPAAGDYPWYDFLQEINCAERRREDVVPLFGDETYFWIFNDKGNVHSESQGEPIGMEIRAQAFAFSTNDEINNMTFYNYVMINQGTQTLGDTYFGTWVDADVGTSIDDYVGCDVQRGLGYAYNGDAFDEPTASSPGYGANPPAVGVDFFEGPYQDTDGIDNPLTTNFADAIDSLGIPYRGIGIGYGDGVIDNERFGMRRFVYYNNGSNPINGEPVTPIHYYNYMNGIWKNGQKMRYGGDGVNVGTTDIDADYMFPGDTDPFNWGTGGTPVDSWTEQTAGNPPADRRFIQAAGPFTLQPGDYNNITVGVVWARANAGDPFASVELLNEADDKAQALFDNCFEIVSGPAAPDVTIQEMDRELILYLTNENRISNNFNEGYIGFDPGIPGELADGTVLDTLTRSYLFQGYQIYQLRDAQVSVSDLTDVDKARLLLTIDKEDEVDVVVNYIRDEVMDLPVPTLMADGENAGIRHSFRFINDAFASGDNRLINHKTYYYMVLAYGYNNYVDYNPLTNQGQFEQFKASRTGANGAAIRVYTGIPHKPNVSLGGTVINAAYGDGVPITRIEGRGNGINELDISPESEADILENVFSEELTYLPGRGPVNIKVVDPLNVPAADFELRLAPGDSLVDLEDASEAFWQLTNLTMLNDADPSNDEDAVHTSVQSIAVLNEELLLKWGISITWQQTTYGLNGAFTEPIGQGSISYDNPSRPWLLGLPDEEGFSPLNWIRSGTQNAEDGLAEEIVFNDQRPGDPYDEDQLYEGILGGTWAPFSLVSYTASVTPEGATEAIFLPSIAPTIEQINGAISPDTRISGANNVDIVFTSDKSKWTRAAVLEMQPVSELAQNLLGTGEPAKMSLRRHPSVDKNGRTVANGGNANEATLNGAQPIGMGWFPGYAIDVETGERLNMAFGEDSWLAADNGDDMLWNPSSRLASPLGTTIYAAGQHWIYVFKNNEYESNADNRMPAYDQGAFMYQNLEVDPSVANVRRVFRACTWVGSSRMNPDYEFLPIEQGLIPNDARVRLRVRKPYAKYSPIQRDYTNFSTAENNWNPLYRFTTRNVATVTDNRPMLSSLLDEINIVPNPYYAYSAYETTKLDNRVKVTNLPEVCTVSIYNLTGTLIRQYQKADPLTSLDWDLKNQVNVPIAGGVYIIHVEVPGVGEKILKWFGVLRPTDLDNF